MTYYNTDYFNWQKNHGAFGGTANLFLYQPFVKPTDKVIDFGSGGGYLLANLQCADKIGIEINEIARNESISNGIHTVEKTEEVPDLWADVIISCHALEHTFQPLDEIKKLYAKLKPGGKIVFVTPYEKDYPWKPNDINQHLYTWSAMNLGNLFTLAGFKVEKVEEIRHSWPPNYLQLRKWLGATGFDMACRIWARYKTYLSQVRLVATKP